MRGPRVRNIIRPSSPECPIDVVFIYTYTNTTGSKQISVEPGFDAEFIVAPAVSKGQSTSM